MSNSEIGRLVRVAFWGGAAVLSMHYAMEAVDE